MTDEQRLEQWAKWIEVIQSETWDLFTHYYVFWEVQGIIKNNTRLSKTPSYFFEWLGEVFIYSSTMFVRRQADRRKDVISFYKLLEGIHRHPSLLTRNHFLSAWGYNEKDIFAYEAKRMGDKLFDEAVGVAIQCLTKAQVKTDIDALLKRIRLIEDYANHFVAHRSQKPLPSNLPTFKDLKDTMKFIEVLLQKYYLLIRGMKMSEIDVESTFIYDWKEIFTFAWIEEK